MDLSIIAGIAIVMLLIINVYLYLSQTQTKSILTSKESSIAEMEIIIEGQVADRQQNTELIADLKIEIASLEAERRLLHERLETQMIDMSRSQEKFEQLANKVLDVKTQKMEEQQGKQMKMLLDPLKEKIYHFQQKLEQNTKEDIARHASLKQQIYSLSQLNERMTAETANLTKALKGDNKLQGNWGEMILESILSKSGLEKGREYFPQESLVDTEGKRQQPDMVIKTPDDHVYIIDSKVSLVAYEKLVNATTDEEALTAQKAHVLSIKSHIDQLSQKKYQELYPIKSPDFILMFVPIETAFSVASQRDTTLFQYAFDKQIVIVTPSTLLATLKTIETMWRNDKQQKYAIDIATQAGKMYDKFQAFTEDMIKIKNRIDQLHYSYDHAMNKLSTGKGNLISKAEKIKRLGAKANKSIATSLTDEATDDASNHDN